MIINFSENNNIRESLFRRLISIKETIFWELDNYATIVLIVRYSNIANNNLDAIRLRDERAI